MHEEFELPFPQYRCPTCGKDLPLGEARMTVTCADHTRREPVTVEVRLATKADQSEIENICDAALGETVVDVYGSTYDVLEGVNMVAFVRGEFAGLLSLAFMGGDLGIVLQSVYPDHQGLGVGSALLKAADAYAAERNLPALRAAVTNDDVPLYYFYQRHGFHISEVAVGLAADRLGSAPAGFSGIPVRDELRLRRAVCSR